MMDIEFYKEKHISSWVFREKSSMLDEILSKTMHQDKEGDK